MLIRDALANLEAHSSTRDKKGTLQCVDKILYASWRLATAGKDAPTVPAKSEYNQHIIDAYKSSSGTFNDDGNGGAGSKDAIKRGLLRKPICNDKPFLYLQDFLLNSRWEEAQIRVLGLIRKVFQANPVNILLLERSVMFGVVFSHLGSFSKRVCDEVMNTIVPTVQSTKWVLSNELEPLGVLLGEMDLLADPYAPSVLSLVERLSDLNSAYRVLFSRTKVLSSLLDAFVRAHDKADPQDPQHGERLSLGIRALCALENMCPQNVQSISPVHGRVLKCIGIRECRQASIGFWKQLLVQDHSGLQRNFDTFVEGFGRLIPTSDTPLKIDVLMMLCFIVQHSVSCKDVFRNNGGFDTLASIMGKFRCPEEEEEEGDDAGDTAAALEALNLFEAVVALIVSAICYYDLNRKFFVSTIGFAIVENVISHARLLRSATPLRVLDSLIALTTECLDIGTALSSDIDQEEEEENDNEEAVKAKSKKPLSDRDSVDIINPQALIIGVRHIQEVDLESALTFLRKVSALVHRVSNKHNVGSSGVLGAALDVMLSIWNATCKAEGRCVPPDTLLASSPLFRGLVDLVVVLGRHGFSPDELAKLLRLVRGEWGVSPAPAFPEYRGKGSVGSGRPPNEGMLEVLRLVCDEGRAAGVPAVEFDMSTGSACVQVEFCAAWPPPGGYTFTAWVRIDALSGSGGGSVDIMGFHMHDLKMRTTLYADATGALCFRMGERDALPLGVTLRPGVWYHLAFLYPRTVIRSANAVLYVDAMLAWSGRLPHMANASPPFMLTIGSLPGSGNGRGDGGKGGAVKWRAGPCYLFEKLLTPNSITALYLLGNTFDKSSLGSVSDFVASNTSIDATRRMAVVRSDSGTVREYDISTIGALDFAAFQMALCLSGQSESEYDSGRELCIMNSASLSGEHRAQLFGACQSTNVCTVPRCIERLGGVFVAFPLVARATSPRGLLLGLQTLVGLVRGNRSNYLEMERSGGYQILAMILSQKAALLSTEHMNALFSFVGFFPPETPASERAIMNKAAFKFLFLHLTTWKETRDVALLTTVLGIFKELVATSAYSTFNAIQMHAVQTVSVLYIQLRDEKLPKEAVTAIFEVIEALCAKSSYAKDDLSHLTGFALSLVPTVILDDDTPTSSSFVEDADGLGSESGAKSEEHPGDTPRSAVTDESKSGGADGAKHCKVMSPHALFTCKKAMETVFRLLVSEECGANLPELLHPYWIFHFLVNDTSSEIVCEALLILAAQYNTTGVSCKFVEAFRKACGFKILHRLMLYRCTQPAVYYPLMCLMLGTDMRMVPRTLDFDCYDLIAKFKRDELKVAVPEVIPILFGMLKCAYEVAISSNASAPDSAASASGSGATSGNGDSAGKSSVSKLQKTFSFSHNPNNSISGSVVNVGVANESSEELDLFTMTPISGHSKTSSITSSSSSSVALSQMAKAKRGNGNANAMSGSGGSAGGNSGGNSNSSHGKWWKKFKNTLNLRGGSSSSLYSLRSISNFWDRRARKIGREDEEAAPQVVQTLVKFIMLVFTSCKEFQEQLFASQEALGRFVAVFFPHSTVCIPDTGKAGRLTMAESSILLLYHLLIQGLEERLRLNPKGMATLEAALLDAVPTGVAEKDARYYQSVALFDLMETAETVFFRKDFFESEVVSHNFAAFCTFVADRLTQNMFTPLTSDKKVFLFLLHILERLDVASQATQELISAIDKAANPSEAATLSRSSKAAAAAALQRNKGFRQDFAAVFGAMNRVIVSILQRGQSYKSRAMELFVVEKVIDKERVLLSAANTDADFVRALMWYVYSMLSSQDEPLKKAAFGALRLILAIRGDLAQEAFIYKNAKDETVDLFTNGIDLIFQTDFHSFESWLKLHKEVIDQAVERRALAAAKAWTEAAAKSAAEAQRVSHQRDADKARTAEREAHKFGTECKQFFGGLTEWASKVDFAEARHFLSWMWDEQDRQDYIAGVWGKTDWFMKTQKCGVWREPSCFERQKWRLDFTEAAFRMRMKLERDFQFYRRYPYVPLEKPGNCSDNSRAPISSDSKAWYEKYSGKAGNTTGKENNNNGSTVTDSKIGDPLVISNNNGDNDNNKDNNNSVNDNNKDNVNDNKDNDSETVYDDVPTRKIRRFLDPSDPIEEYFNCERAESMDTHPGVIVFCRSSIYIVEGFAVQAVGNDARVIVDLTLESGKKSQTNAMQAQQSYYVGAAAVTTADPHPWRKWSHREIRKVIPRRYVLRWIALEIFISDGQNHLLVFDPSDVEHIRRTFGRIAKAALGSFYSVTGTHFGQVQDVGSGGGGGGNNGGSGAINANSGGSAIIGLSGGLDKLARQKELNAMTQQWVEGRLSNFQYLMYLNTMAGRSYNDITQYPVFPWVIADYTSEALDLNNPETFRDLSKPMGALDPARAKIFKKHFNDCMGVCEPYHYSHHYSSAAVVMFFLMRLEPYTNSSLELNGGHWDCPDRQFHNIGDTWRMLSSGTMPQVMELTPEFFYLPEIFVNGGRFLFGVRSDGVPVDDVVLPPWAKGDPREFVRRNMEALESPYVSAHLHEWIDLIFGYKQRGKAAEEALNVFLPESYEGAVDIDAITDDVVRRSKIDMIRNFGQTPQQLWPKTPHPAKSPSVLNPPPPPQWSTPDGTVAPEVVLRTDAGAPVGFIRVVEERRLGKKVVLGAGPSMIPVVVPSDFALFSPSASASSSSSSSSSSSAASGSASATAGTSQAGSLTGSTGSGISSSLSASASSLPSASAVEASQAGSESGLGVGSHAVIGSAELGSASSTSYRYICYGHPDRTLRMYTSSTAGNNLGSNSGSNNSGSSSGSSGNNGSSGSGKCTCAWSSGHDGPVTAARASFDGSVLVTGGKDSIVKVFLTDPVLGYRQAATNLCGHTAPISAIALSRTQSIIVSGDTRGRCIIWDLNKCTYVRGLPEEEGVEEMEEFVVKDTEAHREDPVVCISVHDITGNIAVCTRRRICIWTVNGCLIAQHQMSSIVAADEITACTFSREWIPGRGQTLVTGHAQGAVHVWDMETFVPRQAPAPPEIRLKRSFQVPGDPAPVTALYVSIPKSLPFGKSKLYVGNSLGSVFYYREVGRRKKVF